MKPNLPRNRGFTLIEMLIVIAVLAIALGVVVPNSQRFLANSDLIAATNQVYSGLVFARTEAKRLKANSRLCFVQSSASNNCSSSATNTLGILRLEESKPPRLVRTIALEDNFNYVFNTPENMQVNFQKLGNRTSSNTSVYVEVAHKKIDLKKRLEVCFNGRIQTRKQLTSSEC